MSDLTIAVWSGNRPKLAIQQLRHFSGTGANLLLLEGSDSLPMWYREQLSHIPNVEVYHEPSSARRFERVEHVVTPFVQMVNDDHFFSKSGISRNLDLLRSHPEPTLIVNPRVLVLYFWNKIAVKVDSHEKWLEHTMWSTFSTKTLARLLRVSRLSGLSESRNYDEQMFESSRLVVTAGQRQRGNWPIEYMIHRYHELAQRRQYSPWGETRDLQDVFLANSFESACRDPDLNYELKLLGSNPHELFEVFHSLPTREKEAPLNGKRLYHTMLRFESRFLAKRLSSQQKIPYADMIRWRIFRMLGPKHVTRIPAYLERQGVKGELSDALALGEFLQQPDDFSS